jgi:hypothetical protein
MATKEQEQKAAAVAMVNWLAANKMDSAVENSLSVMNGDISGILAKHAQEQKKDPDAQAMIVCSFWPVQIPESIKSHCLVCNRDVGISPPSQKVIAEIPETQIYCMTCFLKMQEQPVS